MPAKKKLEEVADGIFLEPVPITFGDEVRIKYMGTLASMAQKVYLHTGYGYDVWSNVQDVPMRKTRDGGWSATVTVDDSSRFNFCFKDSADNWDNNSGNNWSYEIHDGSNVGH